MRRYAEGTAVSVESSRAELASVLSRYGIVEMGWQSGLAGDQLMFVIGGHTYRLPIQRPNREEEDQWKTSQGIDTRRSKTTDATLDKEWRRRWRATVLLLKAKLEFADGYSSTTEVELMPYLVVANGQTMTEVMATGGITLLESGKVKSER